MYKCSTPYCRNELKYNGHCSTCRVRKYKKNNPFKYYYNKLKHRAKERGKPFNLCLEQFKLLWLCEPEKWESKQSDAETKWQMDRINNSKGYEFDNIQIITKKRNVHKYIKHDKFHVDVYWAPRQKQKVKENAPF